MWCGGGKSEFSFELYQKGHSFEIQEALVPLYCLGQATLGVWYAVLEAFSERWDINPKPNLLLNMLTVASYFILVLLYIFLMSHAVLRLPDLFITLTGNGRDLSERKQSLPWCGNDVITLGTSWGTLFFGGNWHQTNGSVFYLFYFTDTFSKKSLQEASLVLTQSTTAAEWTHRILLQSPISVLKVY